LLKWRLLQILTIIQLLKKILFFYLQKLWNVEDGHVEVVAGSGLAPNWIDDELRLKGV
jgi:hypothetical protein